MKTKLFLMAMAGVALAGCVSEEVADVKQKDEKVKIAFDKPVTYGNNESRVNHMGNIGSHIYDGVTYTYPKEEKFVIHAVWDTSTTKFDGWPDESSLDFAAFNKSAIKYESFVDAWAPKKEDGSYYYWEGGKVLSYAAYSPEDLKNFYKKGENGEFYEDTSTDITNYNKDVQVSYGKYSSSENATNDMMGLQISNFETPGNPAYHYDLLFSKLELNKTATDMNHNPTEYSGVPVVFQHALSCVRFSIETDEETADVHLHSIKLWGVKTTGGTFKENITIPNSWANWTYTRTVDNNGGNVNPEWEFGEDAVATDYNDAFNVYKKADDGEGAQFIGEPKLVSSQKGQNDSYYDLFLIPQSLEDAMIEVEYKVGESVVHKKRYSLNDRSINNNNVDVITALEIGKRYTFRLHYSSAAAKLDKILFSPSTDQWTEVTGIVVDLAHTGDEVQND